MNPVSLLPHLVYHPTIQPSTVRVTNAVKKIHYKQSKIMFDTFPEKHATLSNYLTPRNGVLLENLIKLSYLSN
jgi:hypothetical protein